MTKKWYWSSEKDVLILLKREIERLGLENNPSRTEFQKKYDKDKCPSPTTIMYKTKMTWKEILEELNIEYVINKTEEKPSKWTKMSRKELKNIVVNEFNKINSNRIKDYEKKRDKKVAPSSVTIKNIFGNWSEIAEWWTEELKFKKGSIVIVDFGVGVGDEKRGLRPALIVSNDVMNNTSDNILVAPLTDFENKVDENHKVNLLPWQTYLSAKHYNLKKSSVVQLEDIRSVSKKRIENRVIDRLSESSQKDIDRKLSRLFYFELNNKNKGGK